MKNHLSFTVLLAGLLTSSLAFSQQTTTVPVEHPSLYRGVRPIGMGNAFVAMPGSDENAPFYNPAAINDYEKKLHFKLMSPALEISTGSLGLVKDVIDLAGDINDAATNGGKVEEFRTFVDQHTGQYESFSLRLPVMQIQHKWFAATVLADSRTTLSFRNRAFTNIEIMTRNDFGGAIGGAYGFFEDQLQAGFHVKVLHRLVIDEVITADDIINSTTFNDTLPRKRATGVGFDLGLKGKIPTFELSWLELLKPTAGFVWQDVGNTKFSGDTPDTAQSLSLGLAIHPVWNKWEFHIENDIREMNQGTTFMKKWSIGAEIVHPWQWKYLKTAIRAGANQGYFAGGLTTDFRFMKLEFTTYGEEAGVVSRQKELRRYTMNIAFGF